MSETTEQKIAHALKIVSGLCDGSRRWEMNVPARPDSDPDLVLSGALRAAQEELRAAAVTHATALATVQAERAIIEKQRDDVTKELEEAHALAKHWIALHATARLDTLREVETWLEEEYGLREAEMFREKFLPPQRQEGAR